MQKKRYKAVIDNQTYTIIGQEDTDHMNLVTKLVNTQLSEIKQLSTQLDSEQAAILLAINAISDQLKKQEQLLKQNRKLAIAIASRLNVYHSLQTATNA